MSNTQVYEQKINDRSRTIIITKNKNMQEMIDEYNEVVIEMGKLTKEDVQDEKVLNEICKKLLKFGKCGRDLSWKLNKMRETAKINLCTDETDKHVRKPNYGEYARVISEPKQLKRLFEYVWDIQKGVVEKEQEMQNKIAIGIMKLDKMQEESEQLNREQQEKTQKEQVRYNWSKKSNKKKGHNKNSKRYNGWN